MSVRASLVSGILPVLSDDRMLLLQRPGGTWEPPAGRLAPGEDFSAGAIRELQEETGLSLHPERILATWVGPRPGGNAGDLLGSVFFASRAPVETERAVRLSAEHLDHRWATVEEWLTLPSWWSLDDIRRVPRVLDTLPVTPSTPSAPFSPPRATPGTGPGDSESREPAEVVANLGAGTVLVNPGDDNTEPRALLLRRRKPPVGLWENPGGMLEPGEDFAAAARRETLEETGVDAHPGPAWWARVEPWRGPDDHELYAGVGFVSPYTGGAIRLEDEAHDAHVWATRSEWESLKTWYKPREIQDLWSAIERMNRAGRA
ncbi:NUDIX hydrolase [Rubrobacter aplysinae]|uniref:NUDIX hydrolase n=1 Tax=Rubrobacter aplysinae TaxID=909625 RepID=UPI00069F7512|nr:NUDIX hydrolase [Rubrobacter aplysinae]